MSGAKKNKVSESHEFKLEFQQGHKGARINVILFWTTPTISILPRKRLILYWLFSLGYNVVVQDEFGPREGLRLVLHAIFASSIKVSLPLEFKLHHTTPS